MKKVLNKLILLFMVVVLACSGAVFSSCGEKEAETLSAPQNLRMEGKVLVWGEVEHATEYEIYLDKSKLDETEECNYDLSFLPAPATYRIEIMACGDGIYYLDSQKATIVYTAEEAVAQGYTEEGFLCYLLEDASGYSINRGIANLEGDIVLPDYYKGLPVKVIKEEAFYYKEGSRFGHPFLDTSMCNQVTTSVRLPAYLEKIEARALACMLKIEEIIIPETVTEIEGSAFFGCINLKKAQLPSNLKIIPAQCFFLCGLTEIDIPDSVEEIQVGAFQAKASLASSLNDVQYWYTEQNFTEVKLPSSLKRIGDRAFESCRQLKNFTLPSGLEYIEYRAFDDTAWYNGQGEGIVYLDQVVMGYKGEMAENTRLTIPSERVDENGKTQKITLIAASAFILQENLAGVFISDGIELGEGCFNSCTSLTEVRLPSDLKVIPHTAFNFCTALAEIDIPEGVTEIGSSAFRNCIGLTKIALPGGLEILGFRSFQGCELLEEVVLPKTLKELEAYPFSRCAALKSVYFEGSGEEWEALLRQNHPETLPSYEKPPFSDATIYTYSAQAPETEGNFWRYVDGTPTIWE